MEVNLIKILSLLFFIVLTVHQPNISSTCDCLQPKSPTEELKIAKAVFVGKVVEVIEPDLSKTTRGGRDNLIALMEKSSRRIKFKIERTWKGISLDEITVTTPPTSCRYDFKVGERYLVYAYGMRITNLGVSKCTRTRKLQEAVEDLKELGEGMSVEKLKC